MIKMSVREARAHFASALEAAERGEEVIITKNGKPVAQLTAAKPEAAGEDLFARLDRIRAELGIKVVDHDSWPEEFDDPAFSREVLGLDREDWDPTRV